jgi:hypothetical protein
MISIYFFLQKTDLIYANETAYWGDTNRRNIDDRIAWYFSNWIKDYEQDQQ